MGAVHAVAATPAREQGESEEAPLATAVESNSAVANRAEKARAARAHQPETSALDSPAPESPELDTSGPEQQSLVDQSPPRPGRVYFAIGYSDAAFAAAASTFCDDVAARDDFDPTVDIVELYIVTTEADFRAAWNDIAAKTSGESYVVQEGAVFSHASKGTSVDGLEFKPGDPEAGLADRGTLSGAEILELPILEWAGDGRLSLSSCNSGGEEKRGWSPAQVFASAQGVTTTGELGFAYFSSEDGAYETIGDDPKGGSVYLNAYERGKNSMFGDSERIPPREYPGGQPLPPQARPAPADSREDRLYTTATGTPVRNGDDAGNFYCEHMFYVAQEAARYPDSQVGENEMGEPLVGFLHVPGRGDRSDSDDRMADTEEVTGAALRGYFEQAAAQAGDEVRFLVTGYGDWEDVDNLTAEFVADSSRIDAAMSEAFGQPLAGVATDGGESFKVLTYSVLWQGQTTTVSIRAQVHDVDATAIDGGAASVQASMAEFQPHAVLSMGYAPGRSEFRAENRADTRNLAEHGGPADAEQPFVGNHSLGRAILSGGRAMRGEDR